MTCTCGHSKAEHDTSDPVDWPCRRCQCENFDEADESHFVAPVPGNWR